MLSGNCWAGPAGESYNQEVNPEARKLKQRETSGIVTRRSQQNTTCATSRGQSTRDIMCWVSDRRQGLGHVLGHVLGAQNHFETLPDVWQKTEGSIKGQSPSLELSPDLLCFRVSCPWWKTNDWKTLSDQSFITAALNVIDNVRRMEAQGGGFKWKSAQVENWSPPRSGCVSGTYRQKTNTPSPPSHSLLYGCLCCRSWPRVLSVGRLRGLAEIIDNPPADLTVNQLIPQGARGLDRKLSFPHLSSQSVSLLSFLLFVIHPSLPLVFPLK